MISALSDANHIALLHSQQQQATRSATHGQDAPAGYQGSQDGLSAGDRVQTGQEAQPGSDPHAQKDDERSGDRADGSTLEPGLPYEDESQAEANEAEPEDPREPEGQTPIEQLEVRDMKQRDREVRGHERAHAAVGGRYAGQPVYDFERGPDGDQYAVGGEVSIDVAPVPGDPAATIEKMRVVRRAALAPSEPSPQDRRVAAEAARNEAEARRALSEAEREALVEKREEARSDDGSAPYEDDGFTAADVGEFGRDNTNAAEVGQEHTPRRAGDAIADAVKKSRAGAAFSHSAYGRQKLEGEA